MAFSSDPQFEHLLRRAGFGARPDELEAYRKLSLNEALDRLINYEQVPDDVDSKIDAPGYVGVTPAQERVGFAPNSVINDARQRWLFRMVHSDRPLQEKMTLFWHNHFATAYRSQGCYGAAEGTRYMAAKASEDPGGVSGQIEMLRDNALGNFRDFLLEDRERYRDARTGSTAGRTREPEPQENFGREIMELFTMGVGNYTEADVYAGRARLHRLEPDAAGQRRPDGRSTYEFLYIAAQHDTAAKTFTLPDLSRRRKNHPGARGGRGDAGRPGLHQRAGRESRTPARYLATKLYRFFVSRVRRCRCGVRRSDRVACTSAKPVRHEGRHARGAAVAASSGTATRTLRATRGRSNSWCAR